MRVERGAVLPQVSRGRHAQAAVVGQPHADQARVRHVADPHRAVKAFAGQINHPVAQIQGNGDFRMPLPKTRHQRRHMPPPEAARGRDAQMPTGLDATGRDTGLGIGHVGQQALTVFQKRAAFVRERNAPRGAHQQFDAKAFFQRVEPAPHDGGRHAFRNGGGRQAATGGDRDEGFELLELAHVGLITRIKVNSRSLICSIRSFLNFCANRHAWRRLAHATAWRVRSAAMASGV